MTQPTILKCIDGRPRTGGPAHPPVDRVARGRGGILRADDEARARLLAVEFDYVPHPSFDDPAARAAILGPSPEPADGDARRRPAVHHCRFPELDGLFEVPPLTPEQERHLFRKMNYLKHRAALLRARIDPRQARAADLDRLERLHAAATAVKDRIVGANLRLVAWVARRHARSAGEFLERVSDGIEALLQAVDRFDFARGFKFSSYAAGAIRNQFAWNARGQARHRGRLVTGVDERLLAALVDRDGEPERERSQARRREAVEGLLERLDERERRIVVARYGLDGGRERTLRELGAELGITKERVRQLELQAHRKLRALAGPRELELMPA
ncbi:MAG TPA: sigma-70 family RNA polymerase sigma factor [Isosphaeraceae bacterium]|jgi:RNA polymerase primary sigma factor|nr:sigma-70 family RNA polymerase sigma factor [Isosphaeraceae bacterium]